MDEKQYRAVFSQLHSSIHEEELVMKRKKFRISKLGAAVLAAALALALGVSAAAVYRSRVQDLVLRPAETAAPEQSGTPAEEHAAPAETPAPTQRVTYDPMPEEYDTISLQGFDGSPEFQAMREWSEFQHNYDVDGEILRQVGNAPTEWDEKYNYNGYSVYSQEMADKMDEIAEKYGLVLHTGFTLGAELDELRERFGNFTIADRWAGYYYEDGTFQFDGEQEVEGFGPLDFQFRRCMKGVLDTVALNITDAASYDQWEHDTPCGETVLLALGPHKALILADLEDCFVAVNILAGTEAGMWSEGSLTPEALEAFADSFDFSIL